MLYCISDKQEDLISYTGGGLKFFAIFFGDIGSFGYIGTKI